MSVILGIALAGAGFYALVNSHFLGGIISRTLGPYSDTLAEHGFASPDPEIWRRMAAQHRVAVLVEPPAGEPWAFDSRGVPSTPADLQRIREFVRQLDRPGKQGVSAAAVLPGQ